MFPISPPRVTVRIIAKRMSSDPEINVAMAIGRPMKLPLLAGANLPAGEHLTTTLKLALHERGEEALMRGAEVGEGDFREVPACSGHVANH